MIRTPVIITFANTKGGVGKTTLCVSFANYLVTKGVRVIVVDCSYQNPISQLRENDIIKYGENHIPYDVVTINEEDPDGIKNLIKQIHSDPTIEIVLVDTPCNIKDSKFGLLLINTDILVIPFLYDRMTLMMTTYFIAFIKTLQNKLGEKMNTLLFFIPNRNKDGSQSETNELWDVTHEEYPKLGVLTPEIPDKSNMDQICTIAGLDFQKRIVTPAFDPIYSTIFDSLNAIRPSNHKSNQIKKKIKNKCNHNSRDNPS